MIVGVATVTMVLSTRIMKNPTTIAHSERQAKGCSSDAEWLIGLLGSLRFR